MKTRHKLLSVFWMGELMGIGLSLWVLIPQAVRGAEKVKLIYGPFNGRIAVESLEIYAQTGEITDDFRLYAKFLDQKSLAQLRYWLNNRFTSDRVQVYYFTNSPEGEAFLTELGTAIRTDPGQNGLYALRSALIEAADPPANSDGWTIIEAMYHFPTEDLQINTRHLFKLKKFWSVSPENSSAAFEAFQSPTNN